MSEEMRGKILQSIASDEKQSALQELTARNASLSEYYDKGYSDAVAALSDKGEEAPEMTQRDARDILNAVITGIELNGKYYITKDSVVVDALKAAVKALKEE